ncbi:hypothetical protein A3J61_02240 [Candidatus Nomurabacteria bacterium RIFCSPHIGHO2_02_FULL_38_15]|uniref:Uncharacterized protein n=1 Tax=Candidatus Nomurabacteria bacterium RIFCSPHIGHO2_02_FULL_38_15 TaxID=1801752 RepID=A0A1F6VQF1_9BACT|nr:MAG: hypothetical protein A3J61_02240 [Candidatus Nomurabacteria bacterium RIFCSPHIGHO2_02_FULL_38_15]
MKSTFKKIILFILIIGAIIIVAILVFGKEKIQTNVLQSQNQSLLSTTEPSTANDSAKFLQSLAQVKSMKLDTTFFANKSYQKLVDFSLPIVLEDPRLVGRVNPFAPLGVDSFFGQTEIKPEAKTDIKP